MTTGARQTLAELSVLQRRTRRSLGVPWFPMVCFGSAEALSAPAVAAAGPSALLPFWLVAAPAGMALVLRHYRRRAEVTGVASRRGVARVAFGFGAACLVGGLLGGFLGGQHAGLVAPLAVTAVGYAWIGTLQRDLLGPAGAVASLLTGTALAVQDQPGWLVELAAGAVLAAGGLILLVVERGRV